MSARNKSRNVKSLNMVRLLSGTAIVAGALMGSSMAQAQSVPSNSWDYDTVLGGNVGKDTSVAGVTDITVTGGNGYVEGNADIYSGHTVNVTGDSGASFAYQDNRANIQSTIDGNLNSNMKVVIIDRDGVFFTKNARIDVHSIAATSGDVAVADVMDGGSLTFSNVEGGGAIINNGIINAHGNSTFSETGTTAFVAPHVQNNGTVTSGRVYFGASDQVTIDFYGDGLIELAATGDLSDALIHNRGSIISEGGLVQISANAVKGTVDRIVNNEGIIDASSATVSGGKIILSGGDQGTIQQSGVIKTSTGGSVEIAGERFKQHLSPVDSTPAVVSAPAPVAFETANIPAIAAVPVAEPLPARAHAGTPYIQAGGGDVTVTTSGAIDIEAGYIDAAGGNIDLNNGGEFRSVANAIRTAGVGRVNIRQNFGFSIQNVIDSLNNTGTGTNTVEVGRGTFNGDVRIDHENVTLQGAKAGQAGVDHSVFQRSVIAATNSGVSITADNATVDGFEIVGGNSGVRVQNADNANIVNNIIHSQNHPAGNGNNFGGYGTGDGVFILGSENSTVDSNFFYGMNDDGIHAVDVVDFSVTNNDMAKLADGDQGVNITNATGTTTVTGNDISDAKRDAIQLVNVTGVANVTENSTASSGNAGVSLVGVTADTTVDDNNFIGDAVGVDLVNSANVVIGDTDGPDGSGNSFIGAERAIEISTSSDVIVEDNRVEGTGAFEGIVMNDVNDIAINDNDITTHGFGVYAKGAGNGDISLAGNTFTLDAFSANQAAARFESGNIDLSDTVNSNTFENLSNAGGEIAIQLDAADTTILSTFDDEFQTAPITSTAPLTLVGDTLGSTVFDNFNNAGDFYVRIEDGTLLGEVIDGVEANFDGVIPNTFSGSQLPAATLADIESRLYDFDDAVVGGRGQIFVGTAIPVSTTFEAFEDIFLQESNNQGAPSTTASLTINGLPFIAGAPTGGNLNDITPAAGGGEGQGGTEDDLAGISPEAGGEEAGQQGGSQDVTCADDAASSLGGGSVTYTFGGSFEDSIAGASACGGNAAL